jgi:hypothetical protein
MKLCPQCEFIYENDQRFCDMDGEVLVYDSRAGVFPDPVPAVSGARPIKLRPRIVVMAVVAGLALSGLLSFAYHASSAGSKFVSRSRKPEVQETIPPLQIAPLLQNVLSSPATNQPQSPANPEAASESDGVDADELTDKPGSQSSRRQGMPKGTDSTLKAHNSRLTITRRLPPLAQLAQLPQLPPPERLPAAKLEAKMPSSTTAPTQSLPGQKLAVTSQKALVVEVKPARDNVNKQSRLGSFLKKTGRILKKPFKF